VRHAGSAKPFPGAHNGASSVASGGTGERVISLAAALMASLAGWVIDDLFQPYLGVGVTLALSLVASSLAFLYARRWLLELRGR